MVVVDTSVAVKWVVAEEGSEDALKLISRALVAPDLMQAEVGGVLTRKVRRRELSADQAQSGFEEAIAQVSLLPSPAFARSALEKSLLLRHSIYDCYFLAVAETLGRCLVTADRKFAAKVSGSKFMPLIVLLGEEVPDV